MTKFRPCIDLHSGQVKQIVGGTLDNSNIELLKTNYVSKLPASYYASLYRKHDMRGGHVVMLGPGNDEAAKEALASWPGGLQVAGGINDRNARYWIDQGAEKVRLLLFLFLLLPHKTSNPTNTYNTALQYCTAIGHHHVFSLPRRKILLRTITIHHLGPWWG